MIGRTKQVNPCENLNHRRTNAPVGHCPQCGGIVNSNARAERCDEARHAVARRSHAAYCIHCGTQLIAALR